MDHPAVEAYIGVGANLGQADANVRWAFEQIEAQAGVVSAECSPLFRSAPIEAAGSDFCNAVWRVSATGSAYWLLEVLQKIEHQAGRERPYRNAPRTLDLDLLLYGSATIQSPLLTVPHPRMRQRAFVLKPLQVLAPQLVGAADLAVVADQRCVPW